MKYCFIDYILTISHLDLLLCTRVLYHKNISFYKIMRKQKSFHI